MAHVAKFTRGAIGHMLGHYSREKEHLPDNIKPELTHLNYNLAEEYQPMKQIDFVRRRLSEVKVQKRSDVNVLCDWVVTAPKDLPAEDLGQFFESTHAFLAGKYGKENVVSAYVHMDEATPHLHFAFIPVVPDKKKGGYKVSAKECITRSQLKSFHNELQRRLENELGHPVSILNEATKEGNRSIEELKRQSATERLQEATEKASKIVSKAQMQAQGINDSLIAVKAEYEAKKAYVREADRVSDVSMMYPAEAKVTEKGLIHKQKFVTVPAEMWEAKHISANEKDYLQKATAEFEKAVAEFRKTSSADHIAQLEQKVSLLERKVYDLKRENSTLRSQVVSAEKEADRVMDKVNKVLGKLPDEVADRFIKQWNTPERSKSHDWGMER